MIVLIILLVMILYHFDSCQYLKDLHEVLEPNLRLKL